MADRLWATPSTRPGGVIVAITIYSPYKTVEEVLSFDPWEKLGPKDRRELIRRFEAHYRANCEAHDFGVNMTGVYVTLISGFIGLFGWDMLLLAAGTDPRRFGALANRYASWIQQYFDALAESNVPVVMIHDDFVWASGPFMRPAWYREFVIPNYRKFVAPLREAGKKVMFCSDGNFDLFVDDIVAAGFRRPRLRAAHPAGADRREVRPDPCHHRQCGYARPPLRPARGHPRRGRTVHEPGPPLPGLFHGRRQPHPAQHAGGKRVVLQRGLRRTVSATLIIPDCRSIPI